MFATVCSLLLGPEDFSLDSTQCLSQQNKMMEDYLAPIRRWATDERLRCIPQSALNNTIRLARGHLRIAIVLLEPIADEGSYEQMTQRCATLQEIDTLIQQASRRKYSLGDVSVVDVRVLLSQQRETKLGLTEADVESAYNVFQEVMEMKQPDVILGLQCQTSTAENKFARKICSNPKSGVSFETLQIKEREATFVHGFHPSVYLNHTKDPVAIARLQRRLRTTFKIAFDILEKTSASCKGAVDRSCLSSQAPASHQVHRLSNLQKLPSRSLISLTVRAKSPISNEHLD
jgi:hypothetical protein